MFRIKNIRGTTINKTCNLSPNFHHIKKLNLNNNMNPIPIKSTK